MFDILRHSFLKNEEYMINLNSCDVVTFSRFLKNKEYLRNRSEKLFYCGSV